MNKKQKKYVGYIELRKLELMMGWQKIEEQRKVIIKDGSLKDKFKVIVKMPLLKGVYILKSLEVLDLDNYYRFADDITFKRALNQNFKIMKSFYSSIPLFETYTDLLKRGELFEGEDFQLNDRISYSINLIQGL